MKKGNSYLWVLVVVVTVVVFISFLFFMMEKRYDHYGLDYNLIEDIFVNDIESTGLSPCENIIDSRASKKIVSGVDFVCDDGRVYRECGYNLFKEKVCYDFDSWGDCVDDRVIYVTQLVCNASKQRVVINEFRRSD